MKNAFVLLDVVNLSLNFCTST